MVVETLRPHGSGAGEAVEKLGGGIPERLHALLRRQRRESPIWPLNLLPVRRDRAVRAGGTLRCIRHSAGTGADDLHEQPAILPASPNPAKAGRSLAGLD